MRRRKIRYAVSPASRRRIFFSRAQLTFFALIMALAAMTVLVFRASAFLKELASSMAMSDATDMVNLAINDAIKSKMQSESYDYDTFVTLEKDGEGNITAIKSNMAEINRFSSEILDTVSQTAESGKLNIKIPVGNLLGLNLTLGRGPKIPVNIIMLTSSFAEVKNELEATGINQSRHQMILEVAVDIDILVPWETMSTRVVSRALIAETVVVGRVPDTYIDME